MKLLVKKKIGSILTTALIVGVFLFPLISSATSIYTRMFVSGETMIPGAPTDFTGVALSSSEILLSWLPSGSSTVSYNIYRSNIFLATVASSTYLDTGLTPETTYSYQVIAYDKFQRESPPSELIMVTTLASGVIPPVTPPDGGIIPPVVPPIIPPAEPPIIPPAEPPLLPKDGVKPVLPDRGQPIISRVNDLVDKILVFPTSSDLIKPISPIVLFVAKKVPVSVVVTLAGASQVVAVATSAVSFMEIYLLILRQLGALLEFFHIRKKRRPWGTVYDSVTKRPIDPAYIKILQNKKEVGTAITDIDGRYSFVLPDADYYMKVNKTHYLFPSKLLKNKTTDEIYDNLYFGEEFHHTGSNIVELNIPIDPIDFDWNEYVKNKRKYFKINFRLEIFRSYLVKFLYSIGFLFALSYLFVSVSLVNVLIVSLYLLIFTWKTLYHYQHKVLRITDLTSGDPLAFALIRVYLADVGLLIKNVVADKAGRFYVLVRPGKYYLTVDIKKDDGTYLQVYRSEVQNLPNGVLTKDLKILITENMLKSNSITTHPVTT